MTKDFLKYWSRILVVLLRSEATPTDSELFLELLDPVACLILQRKMDPLSYYL